MNRGLTPVVLAAFVALGAGVGGSKYRASGCQKTETYVCKAAEHAVVSCVPESSLTPLADTPTK